MKICDRCGTANKTCKIKLTYFVPGSDRSLSTEQVEVEIMICGNCGKEHVN